MPRDCWLVVVSAQNEGYHGRLDAQRFRFCFLMLDARARKHFLIDLRVIFWRKGAPMLDLEKYWLYLFLHEYIKLECSTRTNRWSSIPWIYRTINICIRNCLEH